MRITNILKNKDNDVENFPGATIAFLGDSITQGCFEVYKKSATTLETIFEQKSAYHAKLKEILAILYPAATINIINAGISGGSSAEGLARIDRDVIKHSPDMAVVCFGLNDCHNGIEGIEEYKSNLKNIFSILKENDIEVIFMTPNMMNINVSCHLNDEFLIKGAEDFTKVQLDGILDKYVDAAREACREESVKLCDCYKIWKSFYDGGVNITEILSNKLNHPIRELHWIFAHELLKVLFEI